MGLGVSTWAAVDTSMYACMGNNSNENESMGRSVRVLVSSGVKPVLTAGVHPVSGSAVSSCLQLI